MNKASRIERICAEANGDVLPLTRVKLSPPAVVPQRTPQTTSQNPQERRDSLPWGNAALLSLQTVARCRGDSWCAGDCEPARRVL